MWETHRSVYGLRKVWRQLRRQDHAVSRCTVARLMRAEGRRGIVRGGRVRTTIREPAAERPLDRVQRQFSATTPKQLWVADFPYVADFTCVAT